MFQIKILNIKRREKEKKTQVNENKHGLENLKAENRKENECDTITDNKISGVYFLSNQEVRL
jgi:hypothetical protein